MNEITIARDLLQNKFICPVSDELAYFWLKDHINFKRMQSNLAPLGVKLVSFGDNEVYAGLNIAMSDSDKKKVVKDFESIHHNISPIVDVLIALSTADDNGDILYPGMTLKHDRLVILVNNNKDFESRLHKVSRENNSISKANDAQIEAMLQKLQKEGLVVLTNATKKIYKVTGKIEYINRIIEFINDNYLSEADFIAEQQGLDL